MKSQLQPLTKCAFKLCILKYQDTSDLHITEPILKIHKFCSKSFIDEIFLQAYIHYPGAY